MKKTLLSVMMLLGIISVQAQKKIAYVTDTITANTPYVRDSLILPMFKADPNFTVTKIQSTVTGQDLSGYDLILIAEAPSSAAPIMATIKAMSPPKPILNMKTFVYKTATGCWNWAATASCIDNATAYSITVNHPGHSILTGFTVSKGDSIQMLTKIRQAVGSLSTSVYKGINGVTSFTSVASGTVDTIAVVKGAATGQITIFELPVGTIMNGYTIGAKYVHIGINGCSWNNLTANALKIVKNAAYYLTGTTILTDTKNPISDKLTVNQSSSELTVTGLQNLSLSLYSASGQRISKTVGNSISINNLNKGIYILKMSNGSDINQTYKFVK